MYNTTTLIVYKIQHTAMEFIFSGTNGIDFDLSKVAHLLFELDLNRRSNMNEGF